MPTYSKIASVEAVLSKAAAMLPELEKRYAQNLSAQTVSDTLLVEIKDFLGNLRSALDYLNGKVPDSDRYFPICDQAQDFTARYAKVPVKVLSVLEHWQPYKGQQWLRWFNILNNKNKHVGLTPQKRTEYIETEVSAPGGSVKWGPGVTFGSGVYIMGVPIDPRTQLPVPNNIVKTARTIWVSFVFDNSGELSKLPPDLSALPFLKDCLLKIATIVKEVETALA